MSGFGDMGGAEHHGGVPVAGQNASAAYGKSDELRGDLARRRRRPRRRWWQFRRRRQDPVTRTHDGDNARQGDGKGDPEHLPDPPRSGPGAIGTGP